MEQTEHQKEAVESTRDLVASGDIDLAALRTKFAARTKVPPRLTDEEIILCCASQNDNYGDDDIVNRMMALSMQQPLNWEGEQPK